MIVTRSNEIVTSLYLTCLVLIPTHYWMINNSGRLWKEVIWKTKESISERLEQQPWACTFIKKETLTQVFSYEFCEISKNTFSTEHLQTTASVECKYLWVWSVYPWFDFVRCLQFFSQSAETETLSRMMYQTRWANFAAIFTLEWWHFSTRL